MSDRSTVLLGRPGRASRKASGGRLALRGLLSAGELTQVAADGRHGMLHAVEFREC